MLIEPTALRHWIDNFYGYGLWDAKIWFVAYEEGGGDLPEEVADKANYFQSNHGSETQAVLCDIRELYRHVVFRYGGPKATLFRNLYEYRFGPKAVQHVVWKNLITFAHSYRNEKLPDLLEYQKNSFASPTTNREALIRLYPLPAPHNHGWYYSWLELPPEFRFLKSRAQYEEHVYQHRIQRILRNILTYRPELVLMYGMNNINVLKKSVEEMYGTKFQLIKAIKRRIPQHHRADLHGTQLVITTQIPALRHNRIETGFDWEELGRMIMC